MTILVYCFAAACSVALSNVDYNDHRQLAWRYSLKRMLLVTAEEAKFFETKLRIQYNKDLTKLLDANVHDVVTPTLESVQLATKEAEDQGKLIGDCYTRTEEILENEAKYLFEEHMRECVDNFTVDANNNARRILNIREELSAIKTEVVNVRSDCTDDKYPARCVQDKLIKIQYGTYAKAAADLKRLMPSILEDYSKILETAYTCTKEMRESLAKVNEPALKVGLDCIDNLDSAREGYGRFFDA